MAADSELHCVKEAEAYFQRHNIRTLLATLLVELAKVQPAKPLVFMQELLARVETTKSTGVTASDTVQFDVRGHIFTVAVPNLRLSVHPDAWLSQAALAAREGDGPIAVEGDPALFPYILDMHRLQSLLGCEKCVIPDTVSKAALMQEARRFGLKVSAESIVGEGDCLRNGGGPRPDLELSQDAQKQFQSWTADHVADWLKTLQHGRFAFFAERFRSEGLDGTALAGLTLDKVKSLGVMDPSTRAALLAAISAYSEEFSVLAVDLSSELAREQQRKQREASPDAADDADAKPVDAAAMMLRSMLGEGGTPDVFSKMISDWRLENPPLSCNEASDKEAAKPCNGILVAARVRPLLSEGPDAGALEVGDFEVVTAPAASAGVVVHSCCMQRDGVTPKVEHKSFQVHRAIGPAQNEELVFKISEPVVKAAADHCVHTTVLCYGQTGSGKTHTVGHLAGHIARYLFSSLGSKSVVLEAFELKGGAKKMSGSTSQAFSLHADSKPELSLFEGADGAMHVGGSDGVIRGQPLTSAHCVSASSSEDLLCLFKEAEQRRASRETGRNAASSRTHAFYRFYLAEPMPESTDDTVQATGACVELVDLAGSESNKDALYHNKSQIDERAKINSSLQALNTCIQKHVQKSTFVPFRSDKLTQLLRPCFEKRSDALDGVPTVLFVACLSPLASDTQQSVRTLTYTQQLTGASGRPARSAKQSGFLAQGRKRLTDAIETGDATIIREAITVAHNNGITGPERRRAQEVLQSLEAALPKE
eukprot:TRINITY_DN93712_c0_g1_i1.p1 TRINITY_DN93712_c0_g1~~TRINITY_DN93712_c0_g1_i1.p1  ORF type:complete len:778 (+),score=171.09 TRINITY_DN93712_c0_g1_i1:40-2334(+)